MTQLVSKHSHENAAFVTYPKQSEKNTPVMKKVVFLLLWKHEKFQLLRLWVRKSFDFQSLVAEKFQFYVEIYTPESKMRNILLFGVYPSQLANGATRQFKTLTRALYWNDILLHRFVQFAMKENISQITTRLFFVIR